MVPDFELLGPIKYPSSFNFLVNESRKTSKLTGFFCKLQIPFFPWFSNFHGKFFFLIVKKNREK